MSAPQASFNLFLMEPMVDLEPGVAEETDRLTSLTLNWNRSIRTMRSELRSRSFKCRLRYFLNSQFSQNVLTKGH